MPSASSRFVTIVGVDFSPISIRALDEALEVTNLRQGEVHAVYVEPEPVTDILATPIVVPAMDPQAAVTKLQEHTQERLDSAAARLGKLALTRVVAHVLHGSPAREIADFAANLDADLVVVGSHGRHGVERFLLGSVAERVVRLARCPVWVVRPKDHAAELKIPEIAPPCPDCVARRAATGGAELWCARHAEHHVRAHRYAYRADGIYGSESAGYHSTPE